MPLQTKRGVLGVIEGLDPEARAEDQMEVLALFADQAALAIESSTLFSSLGRLLFEAAARAAQDSDLAVALEEMASSAPEQPQAELAEVSALLLELRRAGPGEARLAARILREFLAHVRTRGRMT